MIIICTPLSFSVTMFECVRSFSSSFSTLYNSYQFGYRVFVFWFCRYESILAAQNLLSDLYTGFFRYSITKRINFFALLLFFEHEYFPLIVLVRIQSIFALDLKTFHNNLKQYFADINKAT